MTTEDQLKKIISKHLKISSDHFSWTNKFEDINVDSLDFVELVMAIEEEMGIHIEDHQAENFSSFDDVRTFVNHASTN